MKFGMSMHCVTVNGSGFWTPCRAEEPVSAGRVATTRFVDALLWMARSDGR